MNQVGIIYAWMNLLTEKFYIGQTRTGVGNRGATDTNTLLLHRFKQHLSATNNGSDTYFHNALRFYGPKSFTSIIISEHCASTPEELVDILNEAECKAIAEFNTLAPNGYNLSSGGGVPIFHIETRKKMSDRKQKFLNSEDGKLWIESVKLLKQTYYKTEEGKRQAKKHGELISTKYKENPELIEKIKTSVKTFMVSESGKKQRQEHSKRMKAFMQTKEGKIVQTKISEYQKKKWEDPIYREIMTQNSKNTFAGKEGERRRKAIGEKAKERMKDPKKREESRIKTKEYFDRIGRKQYICVICDNHDYKDKYAFDRHCHTNIHKKRSEGNSITEAKSSIKAETNEKISVANKLYHQTHTNPRKNKTHTEASKILNRRAHSKLKDEDVIKIRASKGIITQKKLSELYKVSITTISSIQLNKTYKDVK